LGFTGNTEADGKEVIMNEMSIAKIKEHMQVRKKYFIYYIFVL
jgi:hypothetical protein